MKIIEAVPNISEGQDRVILQTLSELVSQTPAVKLLGVDANAAANRSVFTLAGPPDEMCETLFHFIEFACQHIDMRLHKGAHPRLGAVDVCPLVPLTDISLEQTAQLAHELGRRVGQELSIPVYLYEAAATRPQCRNLADIRRGEYENLAEKLLKLPPDFGPANLTQHVQKTGACVIGARNFLIAFNINLNTRDPQPAKQIAAAIREKSGGLKGVKAIGWYMENFDRAQVSCNITDFHAAPLHVVYERVQEQAQKLGLLATGCELVGLVPLEAMLAAGKHYAPTETAYAPLIQAAIKGLNLCEVKPFFPHEQILEYQIELY